MILNDGLELDKVLSGCSYFSTLLARAIGLSEVFEADNHFKGPCVGL
jgi:hypothetical protein